MTALVETIIFPAVEVVGIGRLTAAFSGDPVLVTDTIPSLDQRPDRMIRVSAGGPSSRPDLATALRSCIFQCWDEDRGAAADLAELAYGIVMATTGMRIGNAYVRYAASVGEPIYFPDPMTHLPRYQFTCSLALAGHAI